MVVCCVYRCTSRSDRNQRKPGVSFHKFPRDNSLRKQWIHAIKRLNWKPSDSSVVCSEHFPEMYLNRTFVSGHTELRENAVPSIFPTYPPHLQPKQKKVRKPPRLRETVSSLPSSQEQLTNNEKNMKVCQAKPSLKEVAVQVNDIKKINDLENSNKHLEWRIKALQERLNKKSKIIKQLRSQNLHLSERFTSIKSMQKEIKSKNPIVSEYALQIEDKSGSVLHEGWFHLKIKKNLQLS